jgi:hypothetical protein
MRLWFADLIVYSEALTLAGVYVPFTDIGAAVLAMLAKTLGRNPGDIDEPDDAVIDARHCNHGATVRVSDLDCRALDAVRLAFYRRDAAYVGIEPVLR